MNAGLPVRDAVHARSSIRDFLDTPVDDQVLRELLTDAARAPSGGNVQPRRVYVVNGESMTRLREYLPTQPPLEAGEYDIYPQSLTEPYRTNRFTIGEQMYVLLGIPREDKAARLTQFARNGDFFGAPAGLFCFVDRQMGPPQWSDLGMFLQTFMLLATERGLATCAQEYWSVRHGAMRTPTRRSMSSAASACRSISGPASSERGAAAPRAVSCRAVPCRRTS